MACPVRGHDGQFGGGRDRRLRWCDRCRQWWSLRRRWCPQFGSLGAYRGVCASARGAGHQDRVVGSPSRADHGEVFRVPQNASWASNSWAPTLVERNGVIYLYFGNGGANIGVATSTSPTGPFQDAIGRALIDSNTPGASGPDMWLFDPTVFIDDDGQAYLYFGGNGENNVRIARLSEDMISVNGTVIQTFAPNFFEAAWMHKGDGLYYFSYSATPSVGTPIDYMTSNSPTEGFEYRGTLAGQPPGNNNNHAGEFEYNGQWYHAYHNRYVATQEGTPTTYKRNLALEELYYNQDGTIQQITYTTDGLPQLEYLDPYVRVEAETTNAQRGIETEPCSEGGMNVSEIGDGDWIRLRGVDFGSAGAESFSARVASAQSGGTIELRLGSETGTLLGICDVPGTGGWQTWTTQTTTVAGASGVEDLYLVFRGSGSTLFNVDWWQFTPAGGGTGGAGGGGGTAGSAGSGVGGAVASGGSAGSGVGGAIGSGGALGGGVVGSGGAVGSGGVVGSGGAVGTGGFATGPDGDAGAVAADSGAQDTGGCGCIVGGRSKSPGAPVALLMATLFVIGSRRRRVQSEGG